MIHINTINERTQSIFRRFLIIIGLTFLFPVSLIAGTEYDADINNGREGDAEFNKIIPLEASIDGMQLSDYEMYWQLNTEGPVLMQNLYGGDYDKKTGLFDVESLSFGENKNTIRFIAKDRFGEVISVRTVEITKK